VVVQPVRVAAAVLVVLQLHERRLGPHAEPGHHPRRRVGLLEVVQRADAEELEHLLAVGVAVHVTGHRRPVLVGQPVEEVLDDAQTGGRRPPLPQARLEVALEHSPQPDQLGVPLQHVGHALDASVVELVERPQSERGVLRLGGTHRQDRVEVVGPGPQCTEEGLGQRATRLGHLHGRSVPAGNRPMLAAVIPPRTPRRPAVMGGCGSRHLREHSAAVVSPTATSHGGR